MMVEEVGGWIQQRAQWEIRWKVLCFWFLFNMLSSALVVPQWFSKSISWIAAHIYFAWSPELARIGLVVVVVGGWISAFTHPHCHHQVDLRRERLADVYRFAAAEQAFQRKSPILHLQVCIDR